MLTCSLSLVFLFFFLFCVLVFILAPCLGKQELIGFPLLHMCREAFEKLNSKRKIWAERSVILDEVDPAIRANLESRGW